MAAKIIAMLQRLSIAILQNGQDDWVPLFAVNGMARRCGASSKDAPAMMLAAIAELLEHGLIELGDVTAQNGFRAWPVPPTEGLSRIAEVLRQRDSNSWEFQAWLSNTDAGDDVAAGMDAP